MNKRKYLLPILTVLSIWPVLCLASEKTYLIKLRNDIPTISSANIGNKILGHSDVVRNLMTSSTISQAEFGSALAASGIQNYKHYWIANIVKVTCDSTRLAALVRRPDVESVFEDLPIELIAPVAPATSTVMTNGPDSNLTAIRAPQAWALGLDGCGSLVCSFDTGVEGAHAALSSKFRGNNGGQASACWYEPYGNTTTPSDNNGHGTHTMGIMVGSDGGDTIGVAPGAQWIAAGVVSRGGGIQQTISDILSAFEWAADPDGDPNTTDDVPDVVNNSWGIPLGYFPACEATFWEAIDNLEAAGVVCIFAAGNEGPNPGTIRIPADRIASSLNSFSVGAVNSSSPDYGVADFSSRGPSACDNLTIKPEVTAPGVGIRSACWTGGYVAMSGTSMAAPHVAGAVAILRQFNPQATPSEIKQALMNSALDLGRPGEDNDYGWGLIDIRKAIDYMPTPSDPYLGIAVETISGDSIILPGESISLNVSVENLGASADSANAHLSCPDSRVQILTSDISFGPLAHGDTSAVLSWNILISDEFNTGEKIILTIELSADGWAIERYLTLVISDLAMSVDEQPYLPDRPLVVENYPNPFNSSTLISISGPADLPGVISIYDIAGRLIKELPVADGRHVIWDGSDLNGTTISAGIYFARLSGNKISARKMLLLK